MTAPAQAEQPVAWRRQINGGWELLSTEPIERKGIRCEPLYAHPSAWVDAGERLPEGDGDVQVFTTMNTQLIEPAFYVRSMYQKARAEGDTCYFTYWRELPPPPSAGKGRG